MGFRFRFFFYFEWNFVSNVILFITFFLLLLLLFRGFVWTIRYLFLFYFVPFTKRCRPKQNIPNKRRRRNVVMCRVTKRKYRLEWNEMNWNLCMNYTWNKRCNSNEMHKNVYSKKFLLLFIRCYSLCSSFVARVQSVFGFECIIIAIHSWEPKNLNSFFFVWLVLQFAMEPKKKNRNIFSESEHSRLPMYWRLNVMLNVCGIMPKLNVLLWF